jgi:hypothetical protein
LNTILRRDLPTELQLILAELRAHVDRKGRGSLSKVEQLLWYCGEELERALYERVQTEKLAQADIETATQKAERNEVDYLQANAQVANWIAIATQHGAPTNPILFDGWIQNLMSKEQIDGACNHCRHKRLARRSHNTSSSTR